MDDEKYTKAEKEAQKWLDETDTMQFSPMELLVMFSAGKEKQIKELKARLHNAEKTLLTIDSLHNDSERTSELVHNHFISTDNEIKSAEFRRDNLNKH